MYQEFVRDFIVRTRENLEFIEERASRPRMPGLDPRNEHPAWEVTQLINSLLGLVILPKEQHFDRIPQMRVGDLERLGWPRVVTLGGHTPPPDLRELMRLIRNAAAHTNIEMLELDGTIGGIRLWNTPPRSAVRNWEAELTIAELRQLVGRFSSLMLEELAKEPPIDTSAV